MSTLYSIAALACRDVKDFILTGERLEAEGRKRPYRKLGVG
ncbi:hypothetical protein [Rhodococcus sp. ABRD24]|nr:hypothetical protein [Rhodococcus sp. ABRD24]